MLKRRWISSVLAATILLAGCSGDDSSSEAYCQSAADLASIENLLSTDTVGQPARVRSAFDTFAASLAELEDLAPSAISGDIAELGLAVEDVMATLATVDFDLTQMDQNRASRLLDPFARPGVQDALKRVDAFDTLNCAASPSDESDGQESIGQEPAATTNADPQATVAAPPTPDPVVALAGEYENLIRTTFKDEEINDMLAFAGVTGVDELVAAIIEGDITIAELDQFLQRTADGIPFAFGDDPDLDILWNACATRDWPACDGLFLSSPLNSLYQRFASTCGQALDEPTSGQCVAHFEAED